MSDSNAPETADGHNAVNPAAEQRDEAPPRPAARQRLVCDSCGTAAEVTRRYIELGHRACCPDCSTFTVAERNEIRRACARRSYRLKPFDYRTADLVHRYTEALARWEARPEGGTGEGPG